MKKHLSKRLLSLFVVVMVVALLPTVFAVENEVKCPECGESVTWTEVKAADWSAGGALTTGHYKLTANVDITAALTVAEGETVCIDLAGFDIKASGTNKVNCRAFVNDGTLIISDSDGTGVISGGYMTASTSVTATGGNILNNGVLKLYSGTISGGYVVGATSTTTFGGNIYSGKSSELYILGGTVTDGTVRRNNYCSTSQYGGGGNIYAESAKVVITGGIISDGEVSGANNTSTTSKRVTRHLGGNIAVVSCSELSISNATITGGKADSSCTASKANAQAEALGGNIYAKSTTVTIENATVSGGSANAYAMGCEDNKATTVTYGVPADADANGGNIYALSGTTIIRNSSVTGGSVTYEVALHADSAGPGTNKTSGSALGGNINIPGGSTAELFDTTVSGGNSAYRAGNMYIGGVVHLKSGAEITGGTLPCTSTAQWGGNIYMGGDLYMYDGSKVTDGTAYRGGNIHFATSNGALYMYGGEISGGHANDGTHDVKVYNHAACEMYMYGGTVDNLYDEGDNNTIEIYNGVIDWATAACSNAHVNEGNIWHNVGACSECGHTYVEAFTAETPNTATTHKTVLGAHTYENGSCTACGAEEPVAETKEAACAVCGGIHTWTAWDGSAAITSGHYYLTADTDMLTGIEIAAADILCLDLGTFTLDVPSTARAFDVYGSLNIMGNGGKVQGSETPYSAVGGIVRCFAGSNFFLDTGATLNGGQTVSHGGNIYAAGTAAKPTTVTIKGTVSNGKAISAADGDAYDGGNIYISSYVTLHVYGTISGGDTPKIVEGEETTYVSSSYGGNIYATNGNNGIKIYDGAVISGGKAGDGDNIFVLKGVTVEMYGGEVKDRAGAEDNDGLYIGEYESVPSAFTMTGGYVEDLGVKKTASASIAAGCTLNTNPAAYLHNCVALNDASAGNYVTYADFDTAFAASVIDDTIILGKEAEVDALVLSGQTVDLNGYDLTVTGEMDASIGHVIDSKGTGTLVAAEVMFKGDNAMLPVKTGDGYVFETPVIKEGYTVAPVEGEDTAKYAFYIENTAEAVPEMVEALKDGTLQLVIEVDWDQNPDSQAHRFVLDGDMVNLYADNWDTKMIVLNLVGLTDVTGLTCNAVIESCGVTKG